MTPRWSCEQRAHSSLSKRATTSHRLFHSSFHPDTHTHYVKLEVANVHMSNCLMILMKDFGSHARLYRRLLQCGDKVFGSGFIPIEVFFFCRIHFHRNGQLYLTQLFSSIFITVPAKRYTDTLQWSALASLQVLRLSLPRQVHRHTH